MDQISSLFERLWQELASAFTFSNLQVFLLVGSGLLAIALLVLSMTRWGHAKPVWKCVVLSVAAHILFMAYAYGTHLIFQVPQVVESTTSVKINLSPDNGDETETASSEEVENAKPWNKFASQSFLPEMESLDRPSMDSNVDLERNLKPEFAEAPIANESTPAALPERMSSAELAPNSLPDFKEPVESHELVSPHAPEIVAVPKPIEPKPIEPVEIKPAPPIESKPVEQQVAEADTIKDAVEESNNAPESTDLIDPNSDIAQAKPAEAHSKPETAPETKPEVAQPVVQTPPAQPKTQQVSAKKTRPGDGKPLPLLYEARSQPKQMLELAKKRGGSERTEKAVEDALKWLAAQQQQDGRWDPRTTGAGQERMVFGHNRQGAGINADTGISALAVLAFLAHGHTHLDGPYQKTVQHGLEFLIRSQNTNGDLAGGASFFARTYCHSMSLLAISEALALTGDQRLMPATQAGVNFSVQTQNSVDGGWRYRAGDKGDMSQFGWKVLALHSAKLGGARVPASTMNGMKRFLQSCTQGRHKGLASYRPNEQVSTTMTAEALVCRNFLEGGASYQTSKEATDRVVASLPDRNRVNLYYWYYGTLAMYHAGGENWETWNHRLTEVLVGTQEQTGQNAGSWEPNGLWAGYGGRVYSTAMATLCLEVYYRYLPMYELPGKARKALNR